MTAKAEIVPFEAANDFNRQLAELDKIQDTCKKLLQTKHYQNLGESGIHAIIARAKALGIHPFEALNGGFTCINGKVGMSTEMMAALVRQRGHSIQKDPKSNAECVILHGKRADNGDTWTCTFSRQDAEAAGLWNTATWKKYPQVMLYNRCMSQLFRQLFPDLSLGAGYVEDELREITKTGDYQKDLPVAEVEVKQDVTPLPAMPIKRITEGQANELMVILEQCPKEYIDTVHAFLKKQGWKGYEEMTPEVFEKIMAKALSEREKFAASLKQEPEEAVEV